MESFKKPNTEFFRKNNGGSMMKMFLSANKRSDFLNRLCELFLFYEKNSKFINAHFNISIAEFEALVLTC